MPPNFDWISSCRSRWVGSPSEIGTNPSGWTWFSRIRIGVDLRAAHDLLPPLFPHGVGQGGRLRRLCVDRDKAVCIHVRATLLARAPNEVGIGPQQRNVDQRGGLRTGSERGLSHNVSVGDLQTRSTAAGEGARRRTVCRKLRSVARPQRIHPPPQR